MTGNNIKILMKSNGYSVIKLSKYLGISEQAVYSWMRGEKMPNIDNLVIVADLFNTNVDEIIIRKEIE